MTAAALDQRDLARLVHVHLELVTSRLAVRRRRRRGHGRHRGHAVQVRPVGARRVTAFPFRQRRGPHRSRPPVIRVRLAETAAPEMP